MRLDSLNSVINSYPNAKDRFRAFTFIEFIKEFGGDNTDAEFLSSYKDYLNQWTEIQTVDVNVSKEEYVKAKMLDILRSITITYASYEEQQFLASIDWSNAEQIKTTIPLYVRKIREICEFYRSKRNSIPLIIKKNSMKGSYQSVEEIIYNKIIDFVFNNRHLQPQMAELKQNLMVSIEKYVDTYSEYFDVPREKKFRIEKEREYMIEANMNDIDWRNYLQVSEIFNEALYSGEVYLEEIGLLADLALDLTQECAGEMLELKNALLYDASLNQIPLTDQIHIRRRFYEKFLGCDLYYLFKDANGNITVDLLCSAKNPSGNLLNCDHPDRAVTPGAEIELLSHVGLFFKPDKTSILKINAKDFSWSVDESKVEEGNVYVFPDPSKYGNIGNNKVENYPLMMIYKMTYDIRSISSGYVQDDPLIMLDEQAWQSYYSKQQDIFKVLDNKDYNYSFTSLSNLGFIHNYQTDVYGNEFALYKGYKEVYGPDGKLDHVEVPEKFHPDVQRPDEREDEDLEAYPILLNGGYFEDPYVPGHYEFDGSGKRYYVAGRAFNFKKTIRIDDYYQWTGLKLGRAPIITPSILYPWVDLMEFGETKSIKFIDHFRYTHATTDRNGNKDDLLDDGSTDFYTQLETDSDGDVPIIGTNQSFLELQNEPGTLFIKNNRFLETRPKSLANTFEWLPEKLRNKKIVNFQVKKNNLLYETEEEFIFAPYQYINGDFVNNLGLNELIVIPKKGIVYSDILWNEKEQVFLIVIFNKYTSTNGLYTLVPSIYRFNPIDYSFKRIVSGWEFFPNVVNEIRKIDKSYYFDNDRYNATEKYFESIAASPSEEFDKVFFSSNYNFENFNYPYQENIDFGRIVFSFNNNLNLHLLAYLITDNNGLPHIYEHKFKITTSQIFNNTLKTNVYSVIPDESENQHDYYNQRPTSGSTANPDGSYFFRPL